MRKFYGFAAILAIVGAAIAARSFAANDGGGHGVKIGAAAPAFTLPDQDGKNVSMSDFAGKIVVLEWTNPGCPFVKRVYHDKIMQTLASKYSPDGVVWIAINSTRNTTNDGDKQWATDQNISYPILNDVGTEVGKSYHATNTPQMFIIGKDGALAYKGAIDNDPDGDKTDGKVNYVAKALDEIISGKSVSEPETKPYGCHVSYAN